MPRRPLTPLLLLTLVACGGAAAPAPAPQTSAAPPPPVCPQPAAEPAGLRDIGEAARELVARMNAKDAAAVFALFSHGMQEGFPLGLTTEFVEHTLVAKGTVKEVVLVEGDKHNGVFVLKAEKGEWRLTLNLDDAGRVAGMRINEVPPPEPPVAESAPLALPARGKWVVAWGGATQEDNPHVGVRDQRRAADLVVVGEGGKHFKTDGKKNEDYLAYGQEVLSMGEGTVVTVVDGVPENAPGASETVFLLGNTVVVDHGKGVFSAYAHLQPGKIKVKPGQKVKTGATLGLVGNSGNSSEPHLHVQLQDAARFETAWGVEGVFGGVAITQGGKTDKPARYTFKKGDLIEPAGK